MDPVSAPLSSASQDDNRLSPELASTSTHLSAERAKNVKVGALVAKLTAQAASVPTLGEALRRTETDAREVAASFQVMCTNLQKRMRKIAGLSVAQMAQLAAEARVSKRAVQSAVRASEALMTEIASIDGELDQIDTFEAKVAQMQLVLGMIEAKILAIRDSRLAALAPDEPPSSAKQHR